MNRTELVVRYTDLTPDQANRLLLRTHVGPMTAAFRRDGLIDAHGTLTAAGRQALQLYLTYATGQPFPAPCLAIPPRFTLPRKGRYRDLGAAGRKLLIALAKSPGLAYKWIGRIPWSASKPQGWLPARPTGVRRNT